MLGLLLVSRSTADPQKESLSGLVSKSVTICGDDDIWSDISKPNSVAGIKGIKWRNIEQIMDGFLENQNLLIDIQDQQIEALQKQIDLKSGGKKSRTILRDEVEHLVTESVQAQQSFGSKQAAVNTACGKPGLEHNDSPPNPAGFEESVKVMQEIAQTFWEEKKQAGDLVKSEYSFFAEACEDTLGFQRTGDAEEDDLASFCDELCNDLATTVQAISDTFSSGRGDITRLLREKGKAFQKRQTEMDKKDGCTNAKTRIMLFKTYLEKLGATMSEKHKLFQKAEWAFSLAQLTLGKMTGALEDQKKLVEQANGGLTDLGQAESSTREGMETAQAALEVATSDLESATEKWNSLVADLVAVRAAEKFSDDVKQRLSKLLLSMDGFADECVREPVRNMGLSEETHVYKGDFFREKVGELQANEDMKLALAAFHRYCKGTATDIFARVIDKVDLSPLCDLGDQNETMEEITGAVQQRKDLVVKAIQDVQSWLDPFKGTLVTKENEQSDYVDAGEPLGLRRVVGPMSQGSPNMFYSDYLKKWKKKGEFLDLLASIKHAIVNLDERVRAAADEMDRLTANSDQAQNKLSEATVAFQKAAQEHALEKQEVTEALTDLRQKVEQHKLSLEDLRRRMEEAKEAWRVAKDDLLTKHAEATSSLSENYATLE